MVLTKFQTTLQRHSLKAFVTIFLGIGVLSTLVGCSRHRVSFISVSGLEVLDTAQKDEVLATFRASSADIQSYRSLSRGTITTGDTYSTLRYAFVFRRPGDLRLEALPLTAAYTLSLLVVSDGRYTLLEPGEKRAFQSSDGLQLIRRLLKVPLREDDLWSLMVGRIPEKYLKTGAATEVMKDPSSARVVVIAQGGAVRFEGDATSGVVLKAQYDEIFREETVLAVTYGLYEQENAVQLPRSISLELPSGDTRIDLDITSAQCNGNYRDSLFQITVPQDYEVTEQ